MRPFFSTPVVLVGLAGAAYGAFGGFPGMLVGLSLAAMLCEALGVHGDVIFLVAMVLNPLIFGAVGLLGAHGIRLLIKTFTNVDD